MVHKAFGWLPPAEDMWVTWEACIYRHPACRPEAHMLLLARAVLVCWPVAFDAQRVLAGTSCSRCSSAAR